MLDYQIESRMNNKDIQLKLFELGFVWNSGTKSIINLSDEFLIQIDSKAMTMKFGIIPIYTPITLPELREKLEIQQRKIK